MRIKSLAKKIIYQIQQMAFEPSIQPFEIKHIKGRFFYGTVTAEQWYFPIRPLPRLEYEWLLDNVEFSKRKILDGGCHHGHYSIFFALASSGTCDLVSVDPIPLNIQLTEINLRLNGFQPRLVQGAIYNKDGIINFENVSNGKILQNGGIEVKSFRLNSIYPEAEIIKLDIEGAEFEVLADSINDLEKVSVLIIELHPNKRNADQLIQPLMDKGYKIMWVNPITHSVEPYTPGANWNFHHATIFALR